VHIFKGYKLKRCLQCCKHLVPFFTMKGTCRKKTRLRREKNDSSLRSLSGHLTFPFGHLTSNPGGNPGPLNYTVIIELHVLTYTCCEICHYNM
jgi:hypothetical protein